MIHGFEQYLAKLKVSGLRPTKQRLAICKILFGRTTTFHFTINDLVNLLERKLDKKISSYLKRKSREPRR